MVKQFIANAAALALATFIVPGITLGAGTDRQKVLALCLVAVIFGALNAFVKPIFKFVSGLLILLTLGLFLWVINAVMLMLTSHIARRLGLSWQVHTWGAAFLGALIIALTSSIVGNALKRAERER